jgi:hypothetical protein
MLYRPNYAESASGGNSTTRLAILSTKQSSASEGHSGDAGLDNLLPRVTGRMLDTLDREGAPLHARPQTSQL